MNKFVSELVDILKKGGVGVLPTDTIYGLVGSALSKKAVLRIYKIRKRDRKKPMIILIGSINDLKLFKIKIDKKTKEILNKYWPGKVSIILPCRNKDFSYLHRRTETLAFRLPQYKDLRDLLKKTGPLVAPSANPEGLKPARTIEKSKDYFGDTVDFYVDEGRLSSDPSTLIAIEFGKVVIKREGSVKINK